MAYVTVEDDTAAIELLAFSNVLNQYGSYLRENQPVVITGRLSMRDDKEPQIVVNRARPMSDYEGQAPAPQIQQDIPQSEQPKTLYLRLATEDQLIYPKVKAIINMFPGKDTAVLYFADTKVRRGSCCSADERMLGELRTLLGNENVVLK